MLNFLLRYFGKNPQDNQPAQEEQKKSSDSQAVKQDALKQAEKLPPEESAIVDFIFQCRFADARFAAAQKIQGRDALDQVKNAMQKTDRRVYRLVQSRLNDLLKTEEISLQIKQCIETASALLKESGLTPNLVADLDRHWKAIALNDLNRIPDDEKSEYQFLYAQLESRLASQLQLQRDLRSADTELSRIQNDKGMTPDIRSIMLDEFSKKLGNWKQSPEQFSLPRQMLSDFEEKLDALKQVSELYTKEFDAIVKRSKCLDQWEKLDNSQLDSNELKKIWRELPEMKVSPEWPELNNRFNNIMLRTTINVSNVIESLPKLELSPAQVVQLFNERFEALQKAIGAGSVQDAVEQDVLLRQLDIEKLKLTDKQAEQLADLRKEIQRLKGWAKWSGQLSREKLIRFVEILPEQNLSIDELISSVVQAREQWKSLNTVSGMPSKAEWAEFNMLCNRAYEPVLEHARQQAQEREKNVLQAESVIENARVFSNGFQSDLAKTTNGNEIDWKKVINFYRQISQSWRQIGLVGKKEKKRLDDEFAEVLQPLREMLYQQTQFEIEQREKLIEEVGNIDLEHRNAGRSLRLIQQKWQNSAKAFPLDNREDRKLWTRFREVCESIHAKRMKKNKVFDEERLQHLQAKKSICTELERQIVSTDTDELENRLTRLLKQWERTGSVPREREADLQKRFDLAVQSFKNQILFQKKNNLHQTLNSLADKLQLCNRIERQIVNASFEDNAYEQVWQSLSALPGKIESILSNRFYAGLHALERRDAEYSLRLKENQTSLKNLILRFEIIYGIDSPAYLMQDRLQMQVEILQDTLSGSQNLNALEVTKQLLKVIALTEEGDVKRIVNLVFKLNEPI